MSIISFWFCFLNESFLIVSFSLFFVFCGDEDGDGWGVRGGSEGGDGG